jgi:hypothetical protein
MTANVARIGGRVYGALQRCACACASYVSAVCVCLPVVQLAGNPGARRWTLGQAVFLVVTLAVAYTRHLPSCHPLCPSSSSTSPPRHLASTAFTSIDMHVHVLGGRGCVGGQHVSVTGQPEHPSKGSACMPTKLQVSS